MSRWGMVLAILSAVLLALAMGVFSIPGWSTVALAMMAGSLLLLLAGVVVGGHAERPTGRTVAGRVLIVLLGGILFYGYLGWLRYSHRPKPDTVGYAEFNGQTCHVYYEVPEDWRFSYNQRHAPHFNQGTLRDGEGHPRLRAYLGTLAPGPEPLRLEAYAQRETEGHTKAGFALEGTEYRETPRGRCWVYRRTLPQGDPLFGEQPVLYVQYAEQWGDTVLVFDFHLPAAQAEELLPLTWQFVRTAVIRSP